MNEIININGIDCYEKDGIAYLKLETVARGLGFTRIANSGNEVVRWERVDKYLSEIGCVPTSGHDGFIPENIFYRLAMKAKNEAAEAFQAKIADEVIPSIRKFGAYMTPETLERAILNPDTMIQLCQSLKEYQTKCQFLESENARQKQLIAECEPQVAFAKSVAASSDTILIRELAKILCQNGIKIGQNRLFQWMRDNGYLIRKPGRDYNMPTQYSLEHGLMCVTESSYIDAYGEVQLCFTPRITAKGQQYFVNKFLNKEACV